MADTRIVVREAGPADWEIIAAQNAAMALESEGRTLDPAVLGAGVRAGLGDAHKARYFLAEVNGQIAGQTMITLEWSDWRNGWFWWIQSVYVAPAFRRRGVFGTLYRHIREAARRAGDVCGLRLYVERENHVARKTYLSLGMGESGYLVLEEDWSAAAS